MEDYILINQDLLSGLIKAKDKMALSIFVHIALKVAESPTVVNLMGDLIEVPRGSVFLSDDEFLIFKGNTLSKTKHALNYLKKVKLIKWKTIKGRKLISILLSDSTVKLGGGPR